MKCEHCGGEFTPRAKGGRPQRYCSDKCQRAHYSSKLIHLGTCLHCGGEIVRPRRGDDAALFCSRECSYAFKREHKKRCCVCGGELNKGAISKGLDTCYTCRRATAPAKALKVRLCPDCGQPITERYAHYCPRCKALRLQIVKARQADRKREQQATKDRNRKKRGSTDWITAKQRWAIYERDGYHCHICGETVDRHADPNSDWYPSLDHIIPRSEGGTDDPSNLKCAHRWCNAMRRDRAVAEIRRALAVA